MFSKESLVPACMCQVFTMPHVIIKRHHIVQCWLKILCCNQRVSGKGAECFGERHLQMKAMPRLRPQLQEAEMEEKLKVGQIEVISEDPWCHISRPLPGPLNWEASCVHHTVLRLRSAAGHSAASGAV